MAAASLIVSGPRNQLERVVPPDQTFDEDNYAGKISVDSLYFKVIHVNEMLTEQIQRFL